MRIALTHNLRRCAREEESEFDTRQTIATLSALLSGLGHDVVPVEVSGPIPRLIGRLQRARPDVVFNIAEGATGAFREAFYPALFEQLSLPHTGSDAGVLALALDKWLTKRVVADAGVVTPGARLIRHSDAITAAAAGLRFPVIVKPNHEGSSKGITQDSVVDDPNQLPAVARAALQRYPAGVLIEQLIAGRDVSIAWVDGLSPETGGLLPPIAFMYTPTGPHPIYDHALKEAPERVRLEVPAALPSGVTARLADQARRAFAAVGVSGFARADFRVTPRGGVYFLELNPLPFVPDLFAAAAALGASSGDMLACILASADRDERRRLATPGNGLERVRSASWGEPGLSS